jgi:acyl-CoA thioester hydrolase
MQKPLDWDVAEVHSFAVEVLPEHIDGLGHTNNCEYLKWCEKAAWLHSESLGLGLPEFQALGIGMAAVKTELEYCAASYTGQQLCIGTWIDSSDNKFSIIRLIDGATLLRGKTRFACISLEGGKLKRMPALFVQAYAPLGKNALIGRAD